MVLGVVLGFMVVYYRAPGLVAAVALLVYATLLLAIFKMLPVTLTLSGIAGIILSVGMAVDANVLIFERVKEELRTGRTLSSSMEVGFRRAWSAIFDSNVSTLITCVILWWLGSRLGAPQVTGFALALIAPRTGLVRPALSLRILGARLVRLSFALALISWGTGLVRLTLSLIALGARLVRIGFALSLIALGTRLVWQRFDLPGFPAVCLARVTSSRWLSIAF